MVELLHELPQLNDAKRSVASHVVDDFLAWLSTAQLADWNTCATLATPCEAAAKQALVDATRDSDLLYAAWLVRDHVETACHRFTSPEGQRVCRPARIRDVRAATERAALALLVRTSLRDDDFRALYGGFANL